MQDEGTHGRPGRRPWIRAVAIVLGGLTVVGLIGVLALAAFLLPVLYDLSPSLSFESAGWIAATDATDRTRYRMHRDLLRRHQVTGMTRPEVVGLLGPPTETDKFQEWDLVYWMGPEPGLGVDSIWLLLRLAPDGRVAEHQVLTD